MNLIGDKSKALADKLAELKAEEQRIQADLERAMAEERAGALEAINAALVYYKVRASELTAILPPDPPIPRKRKDRGTAPARYADGKGNTWSGHGPTPGWVKIELLAGKSLDDLTIKA